MIILEQGKLPPTLLSEVLARAGPLPAEVLLGPSLGEDAAVVAVEAGSLVVAADPITLTGEGMGRSAVLVNANDVAAMGVRPRWFLATVMLPAGTTDASVRLLFGELLAAVDEAGVVLVGGHTEVTSAVRQPVVSGVMLGMGSPDQIVRSSGASPGDIVVQIGEAPIEGAAVLASPSDPGWPPNGESPSISVVEAALAAATLGATAMHDPTEGGLASGLHEIAEASGVAITINPDEVAWHPAAVAIVEAAGANPWATLASGTLLATFRPDTAPSAVSELGRLGHVAAVIGEAHEGRGVTDLAGAAMGWPDRDEVARLLDDDAVGD
ncbi:MAG: hydrogenase assembly protein HupF [Actinomycetia bacterium]|nr:hydrogenase assembly protein HupF [Actinomycetes bacterium]